MERTIISFDYAIKDILFRPHRRLLLLFWIIAAFSLSVSVFAQVSFGKPEKINDDWWFCLGDPPEAQAVNYEYFGRARKENIGWQLSPVSQTVYRWQTIHLPHDWSVKETLNPSLSSCTGYLPGGIGWYRKTIDIPHGNANDKVYIYFEGVYNRSEVFVNGHSVGKRPNGYVSFMYDITPFVEAGKTAVVAVRVDHSLSADSRWYTGSGIYRDVWLITAGPVHIAQWGVFYHTKSADKRKAVLTVDTELTNGTDKKADLMVTQQLVDTNGKEVAKASKNITVPALSNGKTTVDLTVSNPSLWSVKTPHLYKLKTTVSQNGQTIDETVTTTGIRTLTFDPDKGFALNGEWMKIKGVCIHHDAGVLGAAVPREVWKRRLQILKDLGSNAIRMSHNPQSPYMYEICDEIGLLVQDEAFDEWEFAKRKWLVGWNQGTPGYEGSFDFFEEWSDRDLADMVRRDRNHVSIFSWSIGNEIDYPNDPYSHKILDGSSSTSQPTYGGYKPDQPNAERLGAIAKRLVAVTKQYDTSRPVTAALAGVEMSNQTEYPATLDIAGYNYTENRYEIDHSTYPERIIYGSENGHGFAQWKYVRDNDYIFGQFLWTGIDFLGEAGAWPARGSTAGLLTLAGYIKPRGYARHAIWSETPVAYLFTSPIPGSAENRGWFGEALPYWNYTEGQLVRINCHTNAAKARLILNGKEAGESKDYDDDTGIITWDITFSPGTLEVIGMDAAGNKTCENMIRTTGRPFALTTIIEDNTISDGKGLAQITVQVVDENGLPVLLSDDEVTCFIEGPARLLGLEAGNYRDMGNYSDNVHRTYRGKLMAYIQPTGEPGLITVRFTAPWLKPAEVILSTLNW